MAALLAGRDTPELNNPRRRRFGVDAAKKIHPGALVVLAAGLAQPGTTALGLVAVGRAAELADNSGGGAGDIDVTVERGTFRYANSAAGDAITKADIGADCYVVDDQTVAKTDDTGARSKAGKVWDVDALGVWVEI